MNNKVKTILWAVGIFTVIGVIGNTGSSDQRVQGVNTVAPSVQSATSAPIDTPTDIPTLIPTDTPYPPSEPIVERPAPAVNSCSGASAQCSDGSCSYSAHRQGTCSHHGGVAIWNP